MARILNGISSRTRLLVLTWVHSGTGVKLPIRQIANVIDKVNKRRKEHERIFIAVDGLHALGVEDFLIEELGCDYFIAGCHKWLFGPRGTGFVWANDLGWDKLIPIMTSFKNEAFLAWYNHKKPEDHCPAAWLCTPGGFHTFEHHWALGEAFGWHLQIGKCKVEERILSLSQYLKNELAHMSHIILHTHASSELSSGIVCFSVVGLEPEEVVRRLKDKKILISVPPYHKQVCRITPSLLHQEEDLALFSQVLKELII